MQLRPTARGVPGLTQGTHGARGNLELVAAHAEGGFTVCWFNSDPVGGAVSEPSIPAATWSAGLRVPASAYVDALAVRQVSDGLLEVVGSGPDGLTRWTWSPAAGFELTGHWPGGPGLPFVVEAAGALVVGQVEPGLLVRHRAGRTETAPYDGTARAVAIDDAGTVHAVVQDEGHALLRWPLDGPVAHEPVDVPDTATAVAVATGPTVVRSSDSADALACAWSTMGDERVLEVVSRTGTALTHERWAAAAASCC